MATESQSNVKLDVPAIEVQGLTRTFAAPRQSRFRSLRAVNDNAARSDVEAVAGISFSVEPGERVAFVGPNGAGKSTSIKMLTGILYPTSGSATVLGFTPWLQRKALAQHIGSLFGQRSQLWSQLEPMKSFSLLGSIFGLSERELADRVGELGELLDASDLYRRPMRDLSLGQRMRCELTATLLHRPQLLFLDEPSIGLDLLAKQSFRALLADLNRNLNTTIFLTSHDAADIEHVAERVIVINHGSIGFDGPVSDLSDDDGRVEHSLGELYTRQATGQDQSEPQC